MSIAEMLGVDEGFVKIPPAEDIVRTDDIYDCWTNIQISITGAAAAGWKYITWKSVPYAYYFDRINVEYYTGNFTTDEACFVHGDAQGFVKGSYAETTHWVYDGASVSNLMLTFEPPLKFNMNHKIIGKTYALAFWFHGDATLDSSVNVYAHFFAKYQPEEKWPPFDMWPSTGT